MPQHTDDDRDADIDEKQRSTPNLRRIYDIFAHDDPTELGWCVPSLLPTRLELKLSVRVSSEALPWGMSLLGTPTGHWAPLSSRITPGKMPRRSSTAAARWRHSA